MRIAVAGGTGTVGHHIVDVIRERGHEAVVLSRSTGVDLLTSVGLERALEGVKTVVDVTSVQTRADAASIDFFGTVTTNLLAAEALAGVAHHVLLGIIGSDQAPYGYYAGKMRQEQLVERASVPWTILRAAQFHEFATQVYGAAEFGPVHVVPKMHSQPVAAREVAERLVDIAVEPPAGRVPDLAGPEAKWMSDLVRAWARATGRRGLVVTVPLPGPFGRAMRDGTLLPGPGAQLGVQRFEEWLEALHTR